MPGLVEGNGVLLVFADDFGPLFQATNDAVHRVQKVLVGDQFPVLAGGEQGSLVAHVGNVCSAEAWGLLRKEINVHRVVRFQRAQMHLKNGLSLVHVRHVHIDLPVETSGAHQCLVQNVCAVGGRKDDHPTVGAKTVHLRQELVQGVLSFVVGPKICVFAPCAANGINLIDEDDGR